MELTEAVYEHEDAVSHTDPMYEDDVLRFTLRAAAEARARLNAKYPKRPRMGYLEFEHNKTFFATISDGTGEAKERREVKPLNINLPKLPDNVDPIELVAFC